MKHIKTLILTVFIAVFISACSNPALPNVSEDKAKKAIMEHSPDAIITECIYHSDSDMYEIEFSTELNIYTGMVNASTGNVESVIVKEEITKEDNFVFDNGEPEEEAFIPMDAALTIALSDSKATGSVVLVKNDLNRDSKTYTCIFRAGNKEFTYIINAVTGEVISSETELDY